MALQPPVASPSCQQRQVHWAYTPLLTGALVAPCAVLGLSVVLESVTPTEPRPHLFLAFLSAVSRAVIYSPFLDFTLLSDTLCFLQVSDEGGLHVG